MDALSERERTILVCLVDRALEEAARDGREGPWVDSVRDLLAKVTGKDAQHAGASPVGGEPFGTRVTFRPFGRAWGGRRAIITRAPDGRGNPDSAQWEIAAESMGMTDASRDQLTLGWHSDVEA